MGNLNKNIVRYIIPFYFEVNKGLPFDSLCEKIEDVRGNEKEPLWKKYAIENHECDLYESIQKSMQGNLYGNQGIGQCYRINSDCKQKYLQKLKVINEDTSSVEVSFCDLGLTIFRAGLGFFWYEIKTETSDMEELLRVNNALKEFAHINSKTTILKTENINQKTSVPIQSIRSNSTACENNPAYIKINGKNGGYIESSEIDAEIEGKKDIFFYMRGNEVWYKYSKESKFEFASFIEEHVSLFPNVKYFAARKKTENGESKQIPDKAILFSFVNVNNIERKELVRFLYWLGKGYVPSYIIPESYIDDYKNAIFEPFQGAIWYASMEGCAQMITESENKERNIFFDTTYLQRLDNYFYIYILILHQYYGLLKFDEGISALPNDIVGYKNLVHRKNLHKYKEQFSFFMMNSVFASVSHVTHQNHFFDYLKRAFEIEKMTDLMQNKVGLINEMVEQWQEKLKARNILAFSIIGGIFVVIQTLNNIFGMYDYLTLAKCVSKELYSSITMIASVLLGLIIWLCVKKKY